jgi:hypothetical protein
MSSYQNEKKSGNGSRSAEILVATNFAEWFKRHIDEPTTLTSVALMAVIKGQTPVFEEPVSPVRVPIEYVLNKNGKRVLNVAGKSKRKTPKVDYVTVRRKYEYERNRFDSHLETFREQSATLWTVFVQSADKTIKDQVEIFYRAEYDEARNDYWNCVKLVDIYRRACQGLQVQGGDAEGGDGIAGQQLKIYDKLATCRRKGHGQEEGDIMMGRCDESSHD